MGVMSVPSETTPTPPKKPFTTEKPYKGSEVDSERTPVSGLLPYVKGAPWSVEYYRQLLTKDEEASATQISREAIYQQYQLIKGFELRVTSALETDFETESGEHTMRGVANVYPSFKPIKGDTFVADLFDGRAAVLNVTEVRQLTIFQDTTYEISYEVRSFLNEKLKQELDSKVVAISHFVRDFALNQQNPLVQEDDYAVLQTLRSGLAKLTKQYAWQTYNQELRTIAMPKQFEATYDSYLMNFSDYAFPVNERDPLNNWTRYNVDLDSGFRVKTFWDLLLESDAVFEPLIVKEFDLVSTRYFAGQPVLNGIAYSQIRWAVFPKGRKLNEEDYAPNDRSLEHKRIDSPYSVKELGEMELRYAVRRKILNGLGEIPPEDLFVPTIHPVGIDDFYVLSEYFYTNATYGQSQLELQTRRAIEGKPLDPVVLAGLLKDVPNWGPLEYYYYLPLLAYLIRKAIGGF